jgi:hypothetical protein
MNSRKDTPRERNPFVQHIRMKRSGAHTKPKKSERSKMKIQLRKCPYPGE